MELTDMIEGTLRRLGSTADEVAATLKSQRIQGVRNAVRFLNPVVRYVQAQVVGVAEADVIHGDGLRVNFQDGRNLEVSLPQPVRDFLASFGRGLYPELELSDKSG